ncbi:hypothetical protein ECEC1735_3472, partial [Escherichia coli EC1735]
GGALL